MENIQSLFCDHTTPFTIYVAEQSFAAGKGREFFSSYRGKPNYINTDRDAESVISKIYHRINKKIPATEELIKTGFGEFLPADIADTAAAFSKLLATQEHRAAGAGVLDPIIIQEGKVLKSNISQLAALHKNSVSVPAIIILLRDDGFHRAEPLLDECPDGTCIKFIEDSGEIIQRKITNTGAKNIEGFIDSFSRRCFSTCSNTKQDILSDKEWATGSKVKKYAPRLLKFRADLLCDEKNDIMFPLSNCIRELEKELKKPAVITNRSDASFIKRFLCAAKLFKVFCNGCGGRTLREARFLAKEVNDEILRACVYKYASFFEKITIGEQSRLLTEAYDIFTKNNMADNAVYCKNNLLARQFDTDKISPGDFVNLADEATEDVPGAAGIPRIFNNTGLAFMMTGQSDRAVEYFDKGLEYARSPEGSVQNIAILCNKLTACSYYCGDIEYSDIKNLFVQIFDGMEKSEKQSFVSARHVMNLLIIALKKKAAWAKEFIKEYAVVELFNRSLMSNAIGAGELLLQMEYADRTLPELNIKCLCHTPPKIIPVTGSRRRFIEETGLNPVSSCTWL